MRSKTAVTVLDLMGVKAGRLKGGIRSYRQYVVKAMEKYDLKSNLIVLNGYTGTGKTTLLHQLKDDNFPVIDLEQIAGHRGSIFGQIGLMPNNQKKFDSLLLQELEKYKDKKHILIEGESKRIGKIVIPEFFYSKKECGTQFFLHLPIEVRVENIMDDYKPEQNPKQFIEAFQFIKRNIHSPVANEIQKLLESNNFPPAIALLLEYYYDSRYEHAITKSEGETIHIHAESMEDAFQQIRAKLQNIKF